MQANLVGGGVHVSSSAIVSGRKGNYPGLPSLLTDVDGTTIAHAFPKRSLRVGVQLLHSFPAKRYPMRKGRGVDCAEWTKGKPFLYVDRVLHESCSVLHANTRQECVLIYIHSYKYLNL